MKQQLERLTQQVLERIRAARTEEELATVEKTALARKGELLGLMRGIKDLPPEERASFGQAVNEARAALECALGERSEALVASRVQAEESDARFDPTEPAIALPKGHLHPVTLVRRDLERIFLGLGFSVADGPEVETEELNFDLLNIPQHHPARDLQDTLWLESGQVMRTHTSPVQLRAMRRAAGKVPLRVVAPGRVFRNEAQDATHEHTFHQLEGLMVDEGVSVADLRSVLTLVLGQLFGRAVELRLRPSYFPFVEPGFEVDVRPAGEGRAEWLEMLGCGMVHPTVLRAGGMDPRPPRAHALRHRRPALDDERRPALPAAVLSRSRPPCTSR